LLNKIDAINLSSEMIHPLSPFAYLLIEQILMSVRVVNTRHLLPAGNSQSYNAGSLFLALQGLKQSLRERHSGSRFCQAASC
jgi:hypothetical protein